jgi:excisionase family DNA binding protein
MQAKPSHRYLTSFEVAAACGVSARTVSNWIRHGSIPAHRTLGGHARISTEDLKQFLSDRQMPLPPELTEAHLPAARAYEPPGDPTKSGTAQRPERVLREGPRVLIIDDDDALLEVMREVLGAAGYEVDTARHGFLAGYLLAHFHPNIIVLDIMMPGLDGYEVLSLVRKRSEAQGIPVVACTSLKGPDVESRLIAAGFNGYIKKPIDFSALRSTLAALLPL